MLACTNQPLILLILVLAADFVLEIFNFDITIVSSSYTSILFSAVSLSQRYYLGMIFVKAIEPSVPMFCAR